jgi:hypothetical protein
MRIHKRGPRLPAAALPAAVLLTAVLLVGAAASLPALDAHLQDLRVRSVEHAGPPQLLGQEVLLSFESERITDFVGARFAHEDFQVLHIYDRVPRTPAGIESRLRDGARSQGQQASALPPVFVLLLKVPPEVDSLRYRIVVDGQWMPDPFNPQYTEDTLGERFSVFRLTDRPPPPLVNPTMLADGSVRFSFRAQPGRYLYIAGDFNHWNPYWNRLQEVRPGEYTITLRLPAGRHFYRFALDGERLLDPYNPETGRDPDGLRVSTFELPPRPIR